MMNIHWHVSLATSPDPDVFALFLIHDKRIDNYYCSQLKSLLYYLSLLIRCLCKARYGRRKTAKFNNWNFEIKLGVRLKYNFHIFDGMAKVKIHRLVHTTHGVMNIFLRGSRRRSNADVLARPRKRMWSWKGASLSLLYASLLASPWHGSREQYHHFSFFFLRLREPVGIRTGSLGLGPLFLHSFCSTCCMSAKHTVFSFVESVCVLGGKRRRYWFLGWREPAPI